ncbi:acetate--CoA ligase family protein [Lutibaculum baratangense]|uniref:Putative Acetyl-CoA synthetase (ADP-forming) alpha and beta chains n=1 Tax=Lutibaculum baratangense AMV1 TaxID=631454 RepID=V4RJP1_9HYPH|nr:acetate--CoA ligase family protein [Lutibaculum baratangense]ESR23455.1 putative Acetyl-CoA synthetase (ADP-forming) alpha and beta chains [Lutibaculum baratangense AMV1]
MSRLERVFRPRTLAVIGGRQAEEVVRQCDRMGFDGDIWPVHPKKDEVCGRRCYRSIADLPAAPDAAFVGVNRELTVSIVRALSARGAGGAICYASGFGETHDGAALNAALLEAAGKMPVVGPNCYGVINYLDGALMWPDQHGGKRCERGVAIVTQSSNIAINMTMQRRGLPIAYVATAGNQAQTGLSEIALALLEDPRVTAVGLHVEGIDDLRRYEALAEAARKAGTPVVAFTVGRSDEARAATVSHTASVAGAAAASDAFFDRLGIPRLHTIPEFLETLKLLHVHGPLPGSAISSMSCSGGEAAIMADAAVGRRVSYKKLGCADRARVKSTLNDMVAIANPLDYHTFVWGKREAMADTFSAMMETGFDLSCLVLDFPRTDRCDDADWDVTVNALSDAVSRTGARAAIVASMTENLPEARCEEIVGLGIVPFCGIAETMASIEAAAQIGRAWARPFASPALVGTEPTFDTRTLSEPEAKAALAAAGIPVPRGCVARTPAEAAAIAAEIGFPVALKAIGLAHKSEARGVRLRLTDAAAVEAAAGDMAGITTGFLVECMVDEPVAELLVGVVRDPQFGFLMTLGLGGVLVELLKDTVSLILPATRDEFRTALMSLKAAPVLTGYRGSRASDLEAALDAIEAVAAYVAANAGHLQEIEINPLLVCGEGRGAFAADALIRTKEESWATP